MKSMRRPGCLFLIFCIFCFPAFSQNNYRPGFVELASGEKLEGQISIPSGATPKVILFKKEEGGPEQQLTPATVKGFTIGGDTYISAIVSKDMLPITRQDAVPAGVESTVRDRVFLKELTKGPTLTLYELKEDKLHFYIKKPDGEIEELLYKVFRKEAGGRDQMIGTDNVVFYHIFRNQLRVYALNDDGLLSKIDNSSYTARDLIKMVDGINELASEAYLSPARPVKRLLFGGGLTTANRFTFSGPTFQQLSELQSSTTGGYLLKANADFFGKRKMKNTFVRTEVAYHHFAFKGRFERSATADYFLTINTLSTTLSVAQNLVHTENFEMYIGAGTGINFSSYPVNDIVSTNPNTFQEDWKVKKVWHDVLQLRTGVVYKGINAEIAYRLSGSPFNYPSLNTRYKMLALTVSYGFKL